MLTTSNGATTAAFAYLFNHCAHGGCWTTSEERTFLNRGDFIGYYKEACGGGDSYACKALVVASEDGAWGKVAAVNLSVNAKFAGLDLTDEVRNSIKIDLARGYANLLLSSADQAVTPTADEITKMHWKVFANYGLPASAFTATPMGNTSFTGKAWNWLIGPVGQSWGPSWCTGTCKP